MNKKIGKLETMSMSKGERQYISLTYSFFGLLLFVVPWFDGVSVKLLVAIFFLMAYSTILYHHHRKISEGRVPLSSSFFRNMFFSDAFFWATVVNMSLLLLK